MLYCRGMLAGKHRIGYIDGLRAVAVLAVVASHSFAFITIGQSFGVDLFFVISGFCLAFPTLAKLEQSGTTAFDVYRYAAHRVVRIVPPYYIAIALMIVAAAFAIPGVNRVSLLNVVKQMLFLDSGTTFLTGSFWSLAVEFRWYFIFPLALVLWVKAPRAFIAGVLLVIVAGQATMATSSDMVALPAFLLGIVAAHVRVHGHRMGWLALPACGVLIALAYLKTGTLISPLWELAVFLLVVGAGATDWFSRALSMRWLTVIGVASYSIYLMQGPVIGFLAARGQPAIVTALAGIAAGFAFWLFGERPFLYGPVRAALIAQFKEALAKYGSLLGVSGSIALAERAKPPLVDPLSEALADLRSPQGSARS